MRIVLAVLLAAACAGPYGRTTELVSEAIPGDHFKSLAVIAGDDDDNTVRITQQVRTRLTGKGLSAEHRQGLWESQQAAVQEICRPADLDGVVFVLWNELDLFDCATHKPAYQIRGGYGGTDRMLERLLHYLRR